MKKLMMVAAAIALPAGIVAGSAGTAAAVKPPMTDVHNASITCGSVTGAAKFAPHLTTTGTKGENTNVKLVIGDCTVSNAPNPVTVVSGKGAGVLHSASNNVANLLGPVAVSGQINVKWKSTGKLTFKESSVNVTVVTGGTSGNYASFAITAGDASVSGDFAGTDSGASSTFYAETTQTISQLTTAAGGPHGLKMVNFGTDATHLQGNSLSLG